MTTVAVLRPPEKLAEAIEACRRLGFDCIGASVVELTEGDDGEFDVFARRLLEGRVDYVIFTSTNGVDYSLKKAGARNGEGIIRMLSRTSVFAIGELTASRLRASGIDCSVPRTYSSEGLVEHFIESGIDFKGKRVEIPRSSVRSDVLHDELGKLGADVHEFSVYRLGMPKNTSGAKDIIKAGLKGEVDVFTFTSTMTVSNFLLVAGEMGARAGIISAMNERLVGAIGGPTREALEKEGVKVDIMPERATFEALAMDIVDFLRRHPPGS